MTEEASETAAWLAFEDGRLEEADRIWSDLIACSDDDLESDRLIGHRAYVLVAEKRFDEAREVYGALYAKSRSHKDLHQLGMVEREAGNPERSLEIFLRERAQIDGDDYLALAANLYEQSLLHHLMAERAPACALMAECLRWAERSGDPVMLGAANRLKGDVLAGIDPDRARSSYLRARDHFREAEDRFGVAEVERRIEALPGETLR